MGEAKRRAVAFEAAKLNLLKSLSGDELVVAQTAIRLFERFILPKRYTGGCYLTSMILHRYLADEHGVETEVVVGYINDGTDDIFISHAWIEYAGLKTDLTIHLTEDPILRGSLIVSDGILLTGRATYTYHRQRTQAGLLQEMAMMKELGPLVVHKAEEHQLMLARAANPALMKAYLDAAPEQQGYDAMKRALQ